MEKIFIHLPAYREPELVPTIESALKNAAKPKNLVFGICRQYAEQDGFDNVDKYRNDKRFRIIDLEHKEAKGLPYARALINENLLKDEDYILQLDSHHRFIKGWDKKLISWHKHLEKTKCSCRKPIITGYLPYYNPFDEKDITMEPWQQQFAAFYPHGTIFIRPGGIPDWQNLKEPFPSRFISGHFAFARSEWAREIKHDPDIYFSGEELNLTVRSFTHGYDLFHPHELVIWHATMRTERDGILVWDDQARRGEDWWTAQQKAYKKIRNLLRTQKDPDVNLDGYDLGTVRTLREYEMYAGFHFAKKAVQQYTLDNNFPPNPVIANDEEWEKSFARSFYYLVTITRDQLPEEDYSEVLVAFDDHEGKSINSRIIKGQELDSFLKQGKDIHYEEFFLTDKIPYKVVYWGFSKERGWAERYETVV